MAVKQQFSDDTLTALRETKGLRMRAGTGQHRFIGIWVVVVRDRVFFRSWCVQPTVGTERFSKNLAAASKWRIVNSQSAPSAQRARASETL
jgi:hypothetical protein